MAMTRVLVKTLLGDMTLELDGDKAPATVANFVAYAESGHYDGTIFHRVINNFMIQGGGFTKDMSQKQTDAPIKNEADNGLKNEKYSIAMARTQDPDSASSQFFINVNNNNFLDFPGQDGAGYCVFGKVIEGQDVVDAIVQGDAMEKVEIIRVGEEAQNWDASSMFTTARSKAEEAAKAAQEAADAAIQGLKDQAETTESGLMYILEEEGKGPKPTAGQQVDVHYELKLADGMVVDSSFSRGTPLQIPIGVGKVIPGWDEGIMLLNEGAKATLIVPSELGYGASGAGGVIPPNATLIFKVELVKVG